MAYLLGCTATMPPPNLIKFEFGIKGLFRADLAIGNDKARKFVLVEFEDGQENSLFSATLAKPGIATTHQESPMGWFTACVLYVLIWWTSLFAVLPLGTTPVAGPDPATGWRGAPARPRLARKLLITTLVSAIVWAGCALIIDSHWLSFRHGLLAMPYD
jgi:predicted secreted protein